MSASFCPWRVVYRYMYAVAVQKVGHARAEDAIAEFAVRPPDKKRLISVWEDVIPRFDPAKVESDQAATDTCPFAKWFWTSFFWFIPKWAGHQAGAAPAPGGAQPSNPHDFDVEGWLRKNLTADEYRLYELTFVEKRTQEEIAVILGSTRAAIAKRKQTLIAKIIILLGKDPAAQAALLGSLHQSGEAAPVLSNDEVLKSISTRIGTILDNHREKTPESVRDDEWKSKHAGLKTAVKRLLELTEALSEANSKTAPDLLGAINPLLESLSGSYPAARENLVWIAERIDMLVPPSPDDQNDDHNG